MNRYTVRGEVSGVRDTIKRKDRQKGKASVKYTSKVEGEEHLEIYER